MFPSKALWDVVSQPFKRAQSGLFHGKMKQYGNNVPFSKHKTRRSWLPNIQQKRISSEILGETIRMKVTTRALKTIKTKGGLDKYLNVTPSKLLGDMGMRLRLRVREKVLENKGRPSPKFEIKVPTKEITRRRIATHFEEAREARQHVAQVLGKDGLASAEETIEYLGRINATKNAAQYNF